MTAPPRLMSDVERHISRLPPRRPLPSTVEEWQTRPVPVDAWRHTGPFPIVVRLVDGSDGLVEPGSWVLLDTQGAPVEVCDDDAFRSRFEPRGQR